MVNKKGVADKFYIDSAATSREEIGNSTHWGTVNKLKNVGVPVLSHKAKQITKKDYDEFDYIIAMDSRNLYNMKRFVGDDESGKVSLLLDYTDTPRDVADPWYSGDFETTYNDVVRGCKGFLEKLKEEGKI